MFKISEVSNGTLEEDIKNYKKLATKRYSLSVHINRTAIEKRADEILESFKRGALTLKPKQYALFAKYIEVFGSANREEYFDALQQKADFDVREEAKKSLSSWWQKIFSPRNSQSIKYMSAKKLRKISNKYIAIHKKMHASQYTKPWLNSKAENMRDEAEEYIEAYLKDKIKIKSEDAPEFHHFIKVIEYPMYDDSEGMKALRKLKKEHGEIIKKAKAEKQKVKMPFWNRVKQSAQAKIVKLKENNELYKKAAMTIAGIVTVGSLWLAFKDDFAKAASNTQKEKKIDKTETRAQQSEKQDSSERLIPFSFASNEYKGVDLQTLMSPSSEKEADIAKETLSKSTKLSNIKKVDGKATINDSIQQARINHHKHILKMRLGELQSKKLVNQVDYLMREKLISLPQNITAEDFAYAMEMYRAYGVKSSLNEALNSTLDSKQKLSYEANKKVVEDILAAGPTGLGVKKMAASLNGGKLNHKSVYDRASKKTQKQYKMNMKQWHKLKKQASKAA